MKTSNRGKINLIRIQSDSSGETGKENNWKETWGMCLGAVVSHSLKGTEITRHAHAHSSIFALSAYLLYF